MCELLIRVVDKTSADPWVDAAQLKRGCVVEVFPDDHDYGRAELFNPHWRILKLPGVAMAFGHSLIGPSLNQSPSDLNSAPTLSRAFKLDIDDKHLPSDFRAYIDDDTRSVSSYVANLEMISTIKTRREIPDINILGAPPNIIG